MKAERKTVTWPSGNIAILNFRNYDVYQAFHSRFSTYNNLFLAPSTITVKRVYTLGRGPPPPKSVR